jgi:hypothetical protein
METIVVSVVVGLAGLWVGARLFGKAVGKATDARCPLNCAGCACSGHAPYAPGAGSCDPKTGARFDADALRVHRERRA